MKQILAQRWNGAVELLRSPTVRRYSTNTGVLMLEQFLRAGLNVVVGIYVARYLGPSQFGVFNFIIAQVTIAAALVPLGLNGILVREIVSKPEQEALDLGTAFWAMMVGSVVVSAVVLAISQMSFGGHDLIRKDEAAYTILALSLVFIQPFSVVNFYCLAHVKAFVPASCRILVMLAGTVLKIVAIQRGEPLMTFFVISAIEQAILAVSYTVAARIFRMPAFLGRFSGERLKQMMRSAWPILINGVAVAVHIRMGQIMVTSLSTPHEAGIFAGASRIYEAWIYVPYVCAVSVLPALIRSQAQSEELFHRRLEMLMGGLLWASILLAAFIAIFGHVFINLTFGPKYLEMYLPLVVLMIAALGYSISNCANQYFIMMHREMLVMQRTAAALAINLIAGFVLIPRFQALGAAMAALIATVVANYVLLWFSKQDRALLRSVHRSFVFFRSIRP